MSSAGITFKASDKAPESVKDDGFALVEHFKKTKAYSQSAGGEILMTSPNDTVFPSSSANGLVGSLVSAYNNHHNVVLRPEHFWIAVLTQFSQFVNANSEQLRDKFVDFKGKKELVVSAFGTLRHAPYDSMAFEMTNQIAANLKDASVRDWILPSFSTTTSNDKVVSSVVMMAALQQYFSYKFCLMCGIPSVTLLGTPGDWEDLGRRVDRLLEFDAGTGLMVKWHALLKPIFAELVNASQGKHDHDFWSRVCSHHGGGSGPSYLSGWVTVFCCFNEKGEWQGDKRQIEQWGRVEESAYPLIDTDDIPSGLVTVPVTVDDNGVEYKTRMIAGSFVMDLVDKTTLRPRLDWCIAIEDKESIEKAKKGPFGH